MVRVSSATAVKYKVLSSKETPREASTRSGIPSCRISLKLEVGSHQSRQGSTSIFFCFVEGDDFYT